MNLRIVAAAAVILAFGAVAAQAEAIALKWGDPTPPIAEEWVKEMPDGARALAAFRDETANAHKEPHE
jgi:hypothetical protein